MYRRSRATPWWFSSIEAGAEPARCGRFDLLAPEGSCYLSTTPLGAVLEAFQGFCVGLLPDVELRKRLRAELSVPGGTRGAAALTASRARGVGVTAALWAGQDRGLTQHWAAELRGAGWTSLNHGIQHDPSGRLRAVTLFDSAGEHAPYGDVDGWAYASQALNGDDAVESGLARYGITVARSDPDSPIVSLEESGLL